MISQYMTQIKLVKPGGLLELCATDRIWTLKNSPHPYCSRRTRSCNATQGWNGFMGSGPECDNRVVGDVEKRYSSFHVYLTIRTLFSVNWSLTFRLRSK